MGKSLFLFLFLLFLNLGQSFSQSLPAGMPVLEEALRRKQILGELDSSISFNRRPLHPSHFSDRPVYQDYSLFELGEKVVGKTKADSKSAIAFLPVRNTLAFNSGRPYGWGNGLMIPNVGFQNYISGGVAGHFHFIHFQLMPEFVLAQNRSYQGYASNFGDRVNRARYLSWNHGDHPERFGEGMHGRVAWGQSKLTLAYGAFEMGASTQNIWWGPGQFNALVFSNNAQGFQHLTLNTTKPAKTFLGSFEGQLIMGRLEPSGFEPAQHDVLNQQYFRTLSEDWRYMNGLSVSYQPKWVPGFSLGLNRTFQMYSENMTNSLGDLFPVFEVFTKEDLFEGGHSGDYDERGQDQQVSVFARYLMVPAKAELYFEYGRRDHALNWREFTLNPEHARAYLLGFSKLFELPETGQLVQLRAEMTQQQESVNRYLRYAGLGGGTSWHAHYQARGFTHYGESLGVGVGNAGSNVQTIELSLIDQLDKVGIRLERLANQQDFYYRAFGQQQVRKPWVDLSLGLLLDHQWDRWLLSSNLTFVQALNYQWQQEPTSTPDFPVGKDKFSVFAQAHLMYLLK